MDIIEEEARRCGMYFINQRWIGGVLTNFSAIQSRIDYLVKLEDQQAKGDLPPAEERSLQAGRNRTPEQNMGGFKEMTRLPDASSS